MNEKSQDCKRLNGQTRGATGRSFSALLLWLLALPLGVALAQTGPPPLSLQDAAALLLQRSPHLESAAAQQAAADSALRAARQARLPQVQFGERFSRGNNPVFVFGSLLEQNRFTADNFALESLNDPDSLSNFRSSLTIQLPILAQRAIQSGIESARAGQQMAGSGRLAAEHNLLFQLVSAYFGVELAEAAIQVADLSLESSGAEVRRIESLVEQGLAVKSDLLAMQVQEADFRQQRVQAESDLATSWARLTTLLGETPDQRFRLTTHMQLRLFPVPTLPELIERALRNRPEIGLAQARLEMAEQEVRRLEGRWLPSLGVFAEVGNSSSDLKSGSSDYAVGASLNFSLVEPGRGARIQMSRENRRARQAELEGERQRVRLEAVEAYQAFRSARERLELATQAVSQAEENERIVGERVAAGLTTITESLRSQTALQRARLNLLATRFAIYQGFARIRLASGDLSDITPFLN